MFCKFHKSTKINILLASYLIEKLLKWNQSNKNLLHGVFLLSIIQERGRTIKSWQTLSLDYS